MEVGTIPWFKVDDGFHGHPKVIGLSPSAVGVWLLTGTWAAQYLTDGQVPRGMVARFGGTDSDAAELIAAGLWHVADGGYEFHEWHEYQPSKDAIEAERAAARDRMRERRRNKRGTFAGSSGEQPANVREVFERSSTTPTQPSPAQPDHEPSKEGSVPRERGTRIEPDWMPDRELIAQMQTECPAVDLQAEHKVFIDYWIAQPGQKGVKLDWPATWRNWMRRKQNDARHQKLTPTQRAQQTAAAGRNVAGLQITSLEPKGIEA